MARVFRFLDEAGEDRYKVTSTDPPFEMSFSNPEHLAEHFAETCIRHGGAARSRDVLRTIDTTPPPEGMVRGGVRVPCYALSKKEREAFHDRFSTVCRTKVLHQAMKHVLF